MISFDYYRVFYYVCKYKSFTKAAEILSTSQSSISHTIKNLEHQLGCRLLIRNNRGVTPTPEGKQLYDYVCIGCEQFLKGEFNLHQSVSLEDGIIYLGATETALHCYLFHKLDEFHLRYPNVKLRIHNYNTKEAIAALENGIVDLSIVPSPFDTKEPLRATPLHNFQDILIVGKRYQFLQKHCPTLKEINDYPLISFPQGTKSREYMEKLFLRHGLQLEPMIESATSDLILPMVKHNLGIGFIPDAIANDAINKGDVYQVNLSDKLPSRSINLIYDSLKPHSLASRELIHFLQKDSLKVLTL